MKPENSIQNTESRSQNNVNTLFDKLSDIYLSLTFFITDKVKSLNLRNLLIFRIFDTDSCIQLRKIG